MNRIGFTLLTVLFIIFTFILTDAHGAEPANPKRNVVFILTDDLSWNLVQYMPNVQAMQREGTTFSNYFVTNSLCCPSRSSIFTGKLPHNSGVLTNSEARSDGGYAAFLANKNDPHTFAVALQQAGGYKTAMLGKYLNGYLPIKHKPGSGWDEWDVAGNGYGEFNYNLNQNGAIKHYGNNTKDYLTDVMADLADKFIRKPTNRPFFIEIATFAPHAPYTPAPRDADKFLGLTAPRTPAFGARPDADSPKWLKAIPPLSPVDIKNIDTDFRKRAQSVQAVDQMIGQIRNTLTTLGEDKSTYVIFSSDNGLHMGEYSMRPGKMTPFDIDIRVPLIIVGPGVEKGRTVKEITENIDLCPTFSDIASGGTTSAISPDGRSLLPLLGASTVKDWRYSALIEHRSHPFDAKDPDVPLRRAENPPSYEALRFENALYVEYYYGDLQIKTGKYDETAYYDLNHDPDELKNVVSSLQSDKLKRLHDILEANKNCKGATECWNAQRLAP